MSWSINVTSKSKDSLFNAVETNEHIPTPLKDAMKAQLTTAVIPASFLGNALHLVTFGHINTDGTGNYELKLTPATILD